jgi:peptidyl-prolyl cis-trans isomerase C
MSFRKSLAAALCALVAVSAYAQTPSAVVASRGGAELNFAEIDARMAEIPPDKRAGFLDSPERIEQMIMQELSVEQLANEARKNALDQSPEFKARVALATNRLLAEMRLNQVAEQAPRINAEALAKESYLANSDRFLVPERVMARQILIKAPASCDREPARKRAEEVLAEVRKGDRSFEEIAKQRSDDEATREQGGTLPPMVPGTAVKTFETAAFALKKPGDVSTVVESDFGFHIIQLIEHMPARKKTFDEVHDQLVAELAAQHIARTRKDYLDQTQSMKTDADPDAVASLRSRYRDDGKLAADAPH